MCASELRHHLPIDNFMRNRNPLAGALQTGQEPFARQLAVVPKLQRLHRCRRQTLGSWRRARHPRPIVAHLGDAKPGEFSHSVRCDAVSACRALRIRSSRSLPAGSFLASSLRRRAWFASLSSNGVWTRPSRSWPPNKSKTLDSVPVRNRT
jgi:hypothetical protein